MFSFLPLAASSVVQNLLGEIADSLLPVFGMGGEGNDDWPQWVLPVAIAFLGVSVLLMAIKWALRFAKRVK